jgi:predicted Rossmann fold flavoprotein
LFTFNVPDSFLKELAGVSVPKAQVVLEELGLQQTGPLLITHWGFSGPAILKLSAWGARGLHESQYKATLKINWLPDIPLEAFKSLLGEYRQSQAGRLVGNECPVEFPKKLWKALLDHGGVPVDVRWAMLSKQHVQAIVQQMYGSSFRIDGKSTNKDEFVTCGGVRLQEVDFKTMESKLCPGLYFAGEVLDVDGVTGGFNFQNAWTTAWLAGNAM